MRSNNNNSNNNNNNNGNNLIYISIIGVGSKQVERRGLSQ